MVSTAIALSCNLRCRSSSTLPLTRSHSWPPADNPPNCPRPRLSTRRQPGHSLNRPPVGENVPVERAGRQQSSTIRKHQISYIESCSTVTSDHLNNAPAGPLPPNPPASPPTGQPTHPPIHSFALVSFRLTAIIVNYVKRCCESV